MQKLVSTLFLIMVLFPGQIVLAESRDDSVPLSISSEKMTVKGLEDKVFFEGAVVIQKGDVAMTAGRAEVLLANKNQNDQRDQKDQIGSKKNAVAAASAISNLSPSEGKEIVQIALTHQVEVRQGNRRVISEKAVYDAKEEEIILTGNAEMWEEGYHVKGRVIRLSLAKKRSFVEGSQLTIY
ncbi:MAG: LptA/OstA family protein [Nitrospirota bacterium]